LVRATNPLLREHGLAVTTRQIADAAGVAEGTIFRVFPDKNALLVATVIAATTPQARTNSIEHIPTDLPLRERVRRAVECLRDGQEYLGRLGGVLRDLMTTDENRAALGEHMMRNRQLVTDALVELYRPDADQLRISPAHAGRITLAMVFMTGGFNGLPGEPTLSVDELVTVLLDGVLRPVINREPTTDPAPANPKD
jgi:AcrR family transcriptional regulator